MPRYVFLSLLIVGSVGCTTLGPVNPREYLSIPRPQGVQVVSTDGSTFLMQNPQLIAEDTLVGKVEGDVRRIPLSNVQTIRASRPAPLRTAELLLGGSAVMASVVAWTDHPNSDTCFTPAGPMLCRNVHTVP